MFISSRRYLSLLFPTGYAPRAEPAEAPTVERARRDVNVVACALVISESAWLDLLDRLCLFWVANHRPDRREGNFASWRLSAMGRGAFWRAKFLAGADCVLAECQRYIVATGVHRRNDFLYAAAGRFRAPRAIGSALRDVPVARLCRTGLHGISMGQPFAGDWLPGNFSRFLVRLRRVAFSLALVPA